MVTAGVNALPSHTLPALLWIIGGALAILGTVHYPSPLIGWAVAVLVVAAATHIRLMLQDAEHRAEQREIHRTVHEAEIEYCADLLQQLMRADKENAAGINASTIRLVR